MSENSEEPPANKQEETIHHFFMMNKLLICSHSKLKIQKSIRLYYIQYIAIIVYLKNKYNVFYIISLNSQQ